MGQTKILVYAEYSYLTKHLVFNEDLDDQSKLSIQSKTY